MKKEVQYLMCVPLTKEECYRLIEVASSNLERLEPCDIRDQRGLVVAREMSKLVTALEENDNLIAEISKKDKLINSLTDYIEVLQKGRTPIVFTAAKDELKEVQEFIKNHTI